MPQYDTRECFVGPGAIEGFRRADCYHCRNNAWKCRSYSPNAECGDNIQTRVLTPPEPALLASNLTLSFACLSSRAHELMVDLRFATCFVLLLPSPESKRAVQAGASIVRSSKPRLLPYTNLQFSGPYQIVKSLSYKYWNHATVGATYHSSQSSHSP